MKIALAIFLCLVPYLVSADEEYDWESYKIKYGKLYRGIEEPLRKSIWEEKVKMIKKHNEEAAAGLHTYILGENQFSDLTWEEFSEQYLGYVPSAHPKDAVYHEYNGRALAKKVDLRDRGVIQDVKDQGVCGSCWAYASVAALEGAWASAGNGLLDLSEQQLVDCANGKYGNQGCKGGWMNPTFEYIRDNGGIQSQRSYPYTGLDEACKADPTKNVAFIKGPTAYKQISVKDYNGIKDAVEAGTPVTIAVYVESTFQSYKSGIYTRVNSFFDNLFNLNHAITVIAYDYENSTPYFTAKNSWGKQWGDKGYIHLKGEADTAGFTSKASYPVV